MKPEDVKVCVIRIEGTNCEDEMAGAFEAVGAQAEKVHLKQLIKQAPVGLQRSLEDYDVLAFPGGFSAGDYVRAGAIFAARIKAGMGSEAHSTSMPADFNISIPLPETRGLGSSIPMTTRLIPASATALAQGPVLP